MDVALFTTVKVSKHQLGLFEHAQSKSKWPTVSEYVGNIFNYLIYLLVLFLGVWK